MQTKQYRAASMQEALEMIRRDLGSEASVLHARETRGGLFGWFGQKEVEVTASLDIEVPSRFTATTPKPVEVRRRTPAKGESFLEDLCSQHDQSWRADGNGPLVRVYQQLLAAELGEPLAAELVQRLRMVSLPTDLQDENRINHRLARMLEDDLVCCGPIQPAAGRCKRIALVGPTGVGKTTTVAKLAAAFRVQQQLKVGLITVDTFRVAAIDQLQTYAEIMDSPMIVVHTPAEMKAAVEQFDRHDLVLIDTAGRSPGDEAKIHELRQFLNAADAHEIHLVLSAVAGASSTRAAARKFATVGATALISTKLDEAVSLGALPQVLRECGLPLSYFTDGQNVPGDIAPADPERLARRILQITSPQSTRKESEMV